ncbi:hypothetical protein FOL46_001889 [Perkinsus olseni]|nr:hypothetical protein FOL46_001889 [Perkinsus olseni]
MELYDSFEEAAWLESRTVPVLPERLEADPILHSGAVSTAPSSRPHSPGIYKSGRQLESSSSLTGSARSISPDEARSFDARRAGDKEPVRAAVGPSVLPNSWTPTPKKVEYRATSAAVHPLSQSERCPPSRLSHLMSPPQQQRHSSVKVFPAASVGLLPATTHCLLTKTHHITDAAMAVPSSFAPPVAFPDDPPHPAVPSHH